MSFPSQLELTAPIETGSQRRVEGNLKVTGELPYAADIRVDGCLYVAVLRSPHAHARIAAIETTTASSVPGVVHVLTGADVSHILAGRGLRDIPLLALGKVRFIGEMVVAVVARSRDIAERAVSLVDVEYEPLTAVFDPERALEPGAPTIHNRPWTYPNAACGEGEPLNLIARSRRAAGGDVERAMAAADHVFEHTFRSPNVHQLYLEPHCVTAYYEASQVVHVWSCNKSPFLLRSQLAETFDLPPEHVRVHTAAVGGDFGGKGSPMDIPLCIELSRRIGRPIRMLRTYAEELIAGDPAPAMVCTMRMGVSDDGRLQAVTARTLFNAGAYGGFTPRPQAAVAPGTSYRIPAAQYETLRVYTNNVPTGNMRAPGAPQATFAFEAMVDFVARNMGLDPFDFRRRNLLTNGESNLAGEVWPEQRGIETLELAQRSMHPAPYPASDGRHMRFGRGVALYDRPSHAPAAVSQRLRLLPGGMVEVEVGVPETGTGSHSMYQRIVADELQLDRGRVAIRYVGTAQLPRDVGVGGQQVTVSGANGSVVAAANFRSEIARTAAGVFDVHDTQVQVEPGGIVRAADGRETTFADLASRGLFAETLTEVPAADPHAGATNYAVQIAQVGVDTETGQVFVYDFVSAHDVAEIVEPVSHQGQIEGGIGMGLGFALSEDLAITDGQVGAANLGDYKIPCAADVPPLTVALLRGGIGVGARNVKSIGEMGNVAVAAAVANAVSDALGVCMDSLPLTAEKVLEASRWNEFEKGT
jgi:CO/xanthine dehydrogenase Mo-binding subunit